MPAVEKTFVTDLSAFTEYEAATPSNTVELNGISRRLFVGGAGNLNVERIDGTQVFFQGVPAGTILPIRVKKVRVNDGATTPANATTATNIVALY